MIQNQGKNIILLSKMKVCVCIIVFLSFFLSHSFCVCVFIFNYWWSSSDANDHSKCGWFTLANKIRNIILCLFVSVSVSMYIWLFEIKFCRFFVVNMNQIFVTIWISMCVCVCVCVCGWEKEKRQFDLRLWSETWILPNVNCFFLFMWSLYYILWSLLLIVVSKMKCHTFTG